MEFEDKLIYFTFQKECSHYYETHTRSLGQSKYERFIHSLDLGIEYKRVLNNGADVYEITDEKKWFLAKIKYGI